MDKIKDIAQLKKLLRNSISRFCTPKRTLWSQPVYNAFDILRRCGLHAVVFGGANRTIISRNIWCHKSTKPNRPRDIDIVVANVDTKELYRIFKGMVRRENRFGGLQLMSGNISFDIWPLQTTWRFTISNALVPKFESLPLTTFLNLEAIAIDIWPTGRMRNVYAGDDQFFNGLLSRTLELNNTENPYPALCIIRALVMAVRMKFSIGPKLAKYLMDNVTMVSDKSMEDAQVSHYGTVIFDPCSIRKSIDIIAQENETKKVNNFVPKLGQLSLWPRENFEFVYV